MNNLPDELKKQIPDKSKSDVELGVKRVDDKIHEIESIMKGKVDQLDNIMNIIKDKKIDEEFVAKVGDVREILKKDIASGVSGELVSDRIDNTK